MYKQYAHLQASPVQGDICMELIQTFLIIMLEWWKHTIVHPFVAIVTGQSVSIQKHGTLCDADGVY